MNVYKSGVFPMKKENVVFKDFGEFWHYTRSLSKQQTSVIFGSLSSGRQRSLKESYKDEGWNDLFVRNAIDRTVNEIKNKTGIDLYQIRTQVILTGKAYFMKKADWNFITDRFMGFSEDSIDVVIGGVIIQEINSDTVVLISEKHDQKKIL